MSSFTVIGCGQVKGTQATDAHVATEGGPDADLTGTVNVITQTHVNGGGTIGDPAPMIQLISLLPNGKLSDMQQTDSAGHATLNVFPGGSVTAIYPHVLDTGADLVTYLGVQPNDTLTLGNRFTTGTNNALGSMTVTVPALGGASFYDVFTPCGGFGLSISTSISTAVSAEDSCVHTPYQMVFLAFNSNDVIIGYNFLSPTFQANTTISLGGWSNAVTTTLNLTGLPDEVSNLSFDLFDIANGGQQLFSTFGGSGSPTGGAFTGAVPWGPGTERTMGELFLSRKGSFSETEILDGLSPNPSSWTVADTTLTPWMSGSIVSAGTQTVTWFPVKTTGASVLDGTVALLNWTHQTTISGTTTNIPFKWNVIVPPDITEFTLPALPSPFDTNLPQPEDFLNGEVRLLEIPSATGYDAFRAVPERNLTCPECAVRAGEIPRIIVNN